MGDFNQESIMIGGSSLTYEQGLGLDVLKATARAFIEEVEKGHALTNLQIDPFRAGLARRMVELVFGIFGEIEEDFRSEFEQARAKVLGFDPDSDLPF
jgi:hypothetical protein